MFGTFEGEVQLQISDGDYLDMPVVSQDIRGRFGSPLLRRCRDGEVTWERQLSDLGGDPATSHAKRGSQDYRARIWKRNNAVAILGDSSVVFIDLTSGTVSLECNLGFVGISSALECSGLLIGQSEAMLVAVSTKKLVAVNETLRIAWTWQPSGLIKAVSGDATDRISVEMIDLTAAEAPVVVFTAGFRDGKLTRIDRVQG